MGAPSRRARKIRTAKEFNTSRTASPLVAPLSSGGVALTSWTLDSIFAARDAQLRGQFKLPARMAESMRTDDALAVALENRLAPQRCIKIGLTPANGARGASIASEAEALFGHTGVGISSDTRASIHACLTNHDVAFGVCVDTPREDGSRVDKEMRAWPIEHVRWDAVRCQYMTRVDPSSLTDADGAVGSEVPIVHGDGRWVVFQRYELEPFKHAAILAAALIWARRAYAIRDWAKGSVAHGAAKVLGELPPGLPLQNQDGSLTAEADALLTLLRSVASDDSPVGIKPSGSTVDFMTNSSTAWQVWKELVENAERSAARIYLGTDGTMGTNGGAPGVDIASLFGVASTKVQGDLECISRGIQTGVIEPWCATNFGDSKLAPLHKYIIPDEDSDAARASEEKRRSAFFADIEQARKTGFVIDQSYADSVARTYAIDPPTLPVESAAKAPTIALAPTDLATVVSVNEARASAGLGPLLRADGSQDPDGMISVGEFKAKREATATIEGETGAGTPEDGGAPAPLNGASRHLVRRTLSQESDSAFLFARALDNAVSLFRGRDGKDGTDGAPGPQGPPGTPGEQGPKGDTGPAGKQGPAGKRGPTGKAEQLSGAEAYAHFAATLVELRKAGATLSKQDVEAIAVRHGVVALEMDY